MKFTNSIALLSLSAVATSAFTIQSPRTVAVQRVSPLSQPSQVGYAKANTALNLVSCLSFDSKDCTWYFLPSFSSPKCCSFSLQSDNTADQFKEVKEKAEEATKFLVVDVERAQDDLAKNWGWIAGSGFLTLVLGFASLYLPLFATGVAYDGTVLTIGAAGLVSLFAAFARENGHKVKSALSGVGYLGLSYYMGTHPGEGLNIITLTIASVLAAEGIYEVALAARNKNIEGRPWHFLSGLGGVAASVFLAANIPAASLITPGAALGARLTSNGATKLAVGFAGKQIADKRKKN